MAADEKGHGGHSHAPPDHRGRLAVVLAITSVVLVAEVVGAVLSGSLALVADAGHMLSDVAGLSLAWFAATLSRRAPTDQRTWGYRRAEVLAAAGQAAVLLAVGGFVLVEGDPAAVRAARGDDRAHGRVRRHRPARERRLDGGAGGRPQQQPQPAGGVPRGDRTTRWARWP